MIAAMARRPLLVIVETGTAKVFASALEWPGWSRSGRTEEAALETLAAYTPRYAPVAAKAGLSFDPQTGRVEVVEHLTGDASTNFGVPGVVAQAEQVRLTPAKATRLSTLVSAAWSTLDDIASTAPPLLRKGPRGGGRDRDVMLTHVLEAEAAYARKLGIKLRPPALGDEAAIAELRSALQSVLSRPTDGSPIVHKGWSTAYAARRIAWHALDHAWEMSDRADQADR
jgi:hypothetical protein